MLQADYQSADEAILSDEFAFHSSKKKIKLTLHANCIQIFKKEKNGKTSELDRVLQMDDVVGCSICQGQRKNDTKAYLSIYHYPRIDKGKFHSQRKRQVIEIACNKTNNFEDNLNVIREWSDKLTRALSRAIAPGVGATVEKPFLVFVNPNSGSGRAKNLFQERIVPVWAEAKIPYKMVLTKYQNFAREEIQKLDLSSFAGILSVSGDGLVFECLNGLMDREDWEQAVKMPFGQLPGGSGNSLSCAIAFLAKEAYNVNIDRLSMHMAFLTSKYDILPIDICALDIAATNDTYQKLKTPHRIYSFLSIEWAMIADVDLESEKYRFMGGARFTFGAIKRILNLRVYRGRVSFLPVGEFRPKNANLKILKNGDFKFEPKTVPETTHGPKLKYLKPFDQPVPDDWLIIEDNFVFLLIVHLPLIAKDFVAAPNSKMDDGEMLMIFIREGITKMQLMQILTDTETGGYLEHPLVESVRIKAFRLEPLVPNGNIMVDGEHIPYGPIQGEIIPSLGNCIAKRINVTVNRV